MMYILETLNWLSNIYAGDAMLCNRQKYSKFGWIGTRASIFLMAVFDALLGTREGSLDPLLPHNFPGKGSTSILHDLPRITISFILRNAWET